MTTDLITQTGLSRYDFLELLGFSWKVNSEGYDYAAEHYAPRFENPELRQQSETALRDLYRKHLPTLQQWQDQTHYEDINRIWAAHQREEKERREANLLWAVHPGGDWDAGAYSDAFESREAAEEWVEGRKRLTDEHGWKPWQGRLLHRETPGGEWAEVPTA
ncbi:hypothetical protein [Streptomyces hygroscopicus]|uniref:hypothetical protein n=1 Tax=Streptomyces hygroscopicus TaxID=1912 RepID=UPI0033CCBF52